MVSSGKRRRRWSKAARTKVQIELCERHADGETLRDICSEFEMPERRTVFTWAQKDYEFAERFVPAHRAFAGALVDDAAHILDRVEKDPPLMTATTPGGNVIQRVDGGAAYAMVRIAEAKMKLAAMIDHGRYGDRGLPSTLPVLDARDPLEVAKKIAFVLQQAEEAGPGTIPEPPPEPPAPVPRGPFLLPAPPGLVLDRHDRDGHYKDVVINGEG